MQGWGLNYEGNVAGGDGQGHGDWLVQGQGHQAQQYKFYPLLNQVGAEGHDCRRLVHHVGRMSSAGEIETKLAMSNSCTQKTTLFCSP